MVLNGWKEIQRWERYGLPIYRPSKEQASVIARSDDLDAWLVAGGKRSDTSSVEVTTLSCRIKALEEENAELRQELARLKKAGTKEPSAPRPRTQVQAA
jgi:hypothetical protein